MESLLTYDILGFVLERFKIYLENVSVLGRMHTFFLQLKFKFQVITLR